MHKGYRILGFRFVSRLAAVFLIGIAVLSTTTVAALSSTTYQIQEDFVGGGGSINSNSANYNSQDTIGGAAGVGDASGTAYRTQTGATTTDDPALTVSVDTSSVNLGALSTSITKTGTATFSVINYTSYGYIVQVLGGTPNNGGHSLTGLASPTASATNTEQFGINLKDNTAPDIGAEVQQIPDNTFGFGVAATGYNTVDNFKYVSGDTIASAPKSSGKTIYTISYIANITNSTPGGSYSSNQTLVVIGTY